MEKRTPTADRVSCRLQAAGRGSAPSEIAGHILFVEGVSDRDIVKDWLQLNGLGDRLEVQDLGGVDRISMDFTKPLFVNYKDRIFFLLDSDGESDEKPVGTRIQRHLDWFTERGIDNVHVLGRRELENFIGHEAIAQAAGVQPRRLAPPEGAKEKWYHFKAATERVRGAPYDAKKISVEAYMSLDSTQRMRLFAEENAVILGRLRDFLR